MAHTNSRYAGRARTIAVVCVGLMVAVVSTAPAPLAAAAPSPTGSQAAQVPRSIAIGGSPVAVTLGQSETAEFTYDYDGDGRVRIDISGCTVGQFLLSYYMIVDTAFIWADGHSICDPDGQRHGPFAPPGPTGNTFSIKNTNVDSLSFTVRLVRIGSSSATVGPGVPAPFDLPQPTSDGVPDQTAQWFHFAGVEGQSVRFDFTIGQGECPGADLRFPNRTAESIRGFCQVGDQWPTLSLPETGMYRIELANRRLDQVSMAGTIQLNLLDVPSICTDAGVRPVMLVHGFNGTASDWRTLEPTFVDNLAREFRRTGLEQEESVGCGRLFVRSVNLGPRDSSDANGFLLASTINTFLEQIGASEIDLIAHSKGGLDARRAIRILARRMHSMA